MGTRRRRRSVQSKLRRGHFKDSIAETLPQRPQHRRGGSRAARPRKPYQAVVVGHQLQGLDATNAQPLGCHVSPSGEFSVCEDADALLLVSGRDTTADPEKFGQMTGG